jgi:hypothetical protein
MFQSLTHMLYWSSIPNINIMTSISCFVWHIRNFFFKRKYQILSFPDNTLRLVTDFRKVNYVSKSDTYPIPGIEDCIDKVGHAQFVSKFDLLKGY